MEQRIWKKIIVSPLNSQYDFKEDKYLVCKSDSNNDEFNQLLFVRRDIEKFSIPSNVSKICENLTKVEIPTNSNLQTIETFSFHLTQIESIFIPSKVSKICEWAFSNCRNLQNWNHFRYQFSKDQSSS